MSSSGIPPRRSAGTPPAAHRRYQDPRNRAGRRSSCPSAGRNGTISVNDATSASNFAGSVFSLMKQYGFNGVDIDLENRVNTTFMAAKRCSPGS